jgi:hypothetical protein
MPLINAASYMELRNQKSLHLHHMKDPHLRVRLPLLTICCGWSKFTSLCKLDDVLVWWCQTRYTKIKQHGQGFIDNDEGCRRTGLNMVKWLPGPHFFFNITQYNVDAHNARTLAPYECTHASPTCMTTFEDWADKSLRLMKSPTHAHSPSKNAHTQTIRVMTQGYLKAMIRWWAASLTNATIDKGPNDWGPAKAKQVRSGTEAGVVHNLFHSPWSHYGRKAYDLSSSWPPEEIERGRASASEPALTGASTPHWPHKDQGNNSHLSTVRRQPCATLHGRRQHHLEVVTTGTITTNLIWPNQAGIWSCPLWNGSRG